MVVLPGWTGVRVIVPEPIQGDCVMPLKASDRVSPAPPEAGVTETRLKAWFVAPPALDPAGAPCTITAFGSDEDCDPVATWHVREPGTACRSTCRIAVAVVAFCTVTCCGAAAVAGEYDVVGADASDASEAAGLPIPTVKTRIPAAFASAAACAVEVGDGAAASWPLEKMTMARPAPTFLLEPSSSACAAPIAAPKLLTGPGPISSIALVAAVLSDVSP